MVHLDKIYTRAGDDGQTCLGNGQRVAKTAARVRAMGAVDEANCLFGVAVATQPAAMAVESFRRIQNDLFDLGADLCLPESDDAETSSTLRISAEQTTQLEQWIDGVNESLRPLNSFVLPGGTLLAAQLHHARAVCRRAEIAVWELAETERVNPEVARYLNRLSDLLFVFARLYNAAGAEDILWIPGNSSGSQT